MDIKEKKNDIILKYVNDILENIKKDEITELTQFKDIPREDLMSEKHESVFEKNKKEIFKLYDKRKIGYYRRKGVQYYFLTFLRYSLRDIDYKLNYREVKIQHNKEVAIKLYYSINKGK